MANDNPLKYMLNENCLSRLTALDYIGFIPSQNGRKDELYAGWKIWANYCVTTFKNLNSNSCLLSLKIRLIEKDYLENRVYYNGDNLFLPFIPSKNRFCFVTSGTRVISARVRLEWNLLGREKRILLRPPKRLLSEGLPTPCVYWLEMRVENVLISPITNIVDA